MERDNTELMHLARRMLGWGRNSGYDAGDRTNRMSVVVSATDDVDDWLADPGAGLLCEDTLVLVRESRRGRPLPPRPGTWLPYRGALDEPGDEIQLADNVWLQVTDYASLQYLAVTGLTVVRLYTPDDVEAYLADVRQARRTGRISDALRAVRRDPVHRARPRRPPARRRRPGGAHHAGRPGHRRGRRHRPRPHRIGVLARRSR